MANTNFIDGTTPVVANWLNDVNNFVYQTTSQTVTTLGSKRVFNVPQYSQTGSSLVTINGLVQKITDAYTESSATTITFTEDLEVGDVVTFRG